MTLYRLAIGFIVQAIALESTSASKVAFFPCLSAVFVPILDEIHRRHLRKTNIEAIILPGPSRRYKPLVAPLLALLGVASLELGDVGIRRSDVVLLALPLAFALCFHRAGLLSQLYPDDTTFIAGVQMCTVAVISLLWTVISGHFPWTLSRWNGLLGMLSHRKLLLGLLYSGVCITAWTAFIEQKAIKALSAAETTLMYTLEPLFAAVISAFVLKEHIGRHVVMGALCIISACIWSSVVDNRQANSSSGSKDTRGQSSRELGGLLEQQGTIL